MSTSPLQTNGGEEAVEKGSGTDSRASCSSVVESVGDCTAPGSESLLADIDHAERCLVSAMYREAAEAAASVLRTLSTTISGETGQLSSALSEQSTKRDVCAEYAAESEAAGMVLLQALNEMGRSSSIFDELRSIFGSVGKVPYSLMLTGICLQLCGGFHSTSQTALEEYLSGWSSDSSEPDLLVKLVKGSGGCQMNGKYNSNLSDAVDTSILLHLSRTDYLQLAEIYVLEVLTNLQKNPEAAVLWTEQADLSDNDKQIILEKIQKLSKSQQTTKSCSTKQNTNSFVSPTAGSVKEHSERTTEEMTFREPLEQDALGNTGHYGARQPTPTTSGESKSGTILKRHCIYEKFPFVRTILSLVELLMIRIGVATSFKRTSTGYKLPQTKVLVAGAFTSIFCYALLQRRRYLMRLVVELMKVVRIGLSDLWQLAFNVHLNPLAAVQPAPSLG